MSLQEVSEAADRIKQEIEDNARIIFGSSINKELDGMMRVSIIATGIGNVVDINKKTVEEKIKKEENLFQDPTKKNNTKIFWTNWFGGLYKSYSWN